MSGGASSSSAQPLMVANPKATSAPPPSEALEDDHDRSAVLLEFDGSSAGAVECLEHFMELSSWYPGHNTLRTEADFKALLETINATGRDVKSLAMFDDFASLLDQVQTIEQNTLTPRNRSTLKDLWNLAKRFEQDILCQDSLGQPGEEAADSASDDHRTPRKRRKASRSRSRGRSNRRHMKSLVKAMRKSRKDSSSDSESSDVRRSVPSLMKKASVTLLDPDQFANAKTLKKLVRTLKEKRISSDTYDLFYPQYVGEGQPSDARKTILKNREKASAHSAFTLFEDVMCFWVSHTLGGEVSFEAIVAHMLILFKLVHKHSSAFACRYARLFLSRQQDKCRYSTDWDLSLSLCKLDTELYTQLCDEIHSTTPPPRLPWSSKGKGKGKKGKGKGKQALPPVPPPPSGAPNSREKKRVCFYHNPLKGLTCRFGAKCSDEHLNTHDPKELKRFQDASKAAGYRKQ